MGGQFGGHGFADLPGRFKAVVDGVAQGVEPAAAAGRVAPLLVVRGALPWLRRSVNPRVVNITSWLGSIGDYATDSAPNYGYRTTKAALNMASRAMAADFADEGITSGVVNPGWVQTDMGGGAKADLTPERSAAGIVAVADALAPGDSGRFIDWDGSDRPY